MTVLNELDRFHLVISAIDRLPHTGNRGTYLEQQLRHKLIEHRQYIKKTSRIYRKSATGSEALDVYGSSPAIPYSHRTH